MTVRGRYNESMKNCLLSAAASGAFWLILLFVVSFLAVHTVRLAKIGWNYQKRHVTPPEKSSAEKRGSEPARRDPPAKETSEAPGGGKASRTRLLYRGAQKTPSSGNLFPAERNQIQISNPAFAVNGKGGELRNCFFCRVCLSLPSSIRPHTNLAIFSGGRKMRVTFPRARPPRTFRDCRRPPTAVRGDKRASSRR